MTDLNEKKIHDKAYNAGERFGSWAGQHPFMTTGLVIAAIAFGPFLLLALLALLIRLSVYGIAVLCAVLMAYMAVRIVDSIIRHIRTDGSKKDSEKLKDVPDDWKTSQSFAPDRMLKLAKDGLLEAKLVASKYDEMLRLVDEAGKDANMTAAEYSERMKTITDGLEVYAKVLADKEHYPDADNLIDNTRKAVDSLLKQFHETVLEANTGTVFDANLKMQSIIGSEVHDDSEDVVNNANNDDTPEDDSLDKSVDDAKLD